MGSYFRLERGVQIPYIFHENQTPRSDSANLVTLEPIFCPQFLEPRSPATPNSATGSGTACAAKDPKSRHTSGCAAKSMRRIRRCAQQWVPCVARLGGSARTTPSVAARITCVQYQTARSGSTGRTRRLSSGGSASTLARRPTRPNWMECTLMIRRGAGRRRPSE